MLNDFVDIANSSKTLFTAGPASLLAENIEKLQPCFGRGDIVYDNLESSVLTNLLTLSGQDHIVRLQGSATLAIEIALSNFVRGRVLVVSTGYYSDRLLKLLNFISTYQLNLDISILPYSELNSIQTSNFDWIVSCYTETSIGFRCDPYLLHSFAASCNAKLFLDATASIGLETSHELADICCFSSCKGLFGLTGASFIAYKDHLDLIEPQHSHYLKLSTHKDRGVTGPYHSILSLHDVLLNYDLFRDRVIKYQSLFNDYFSDYLLYPPLNLPYLCTALNCVPSYTSFNPVIYSPRSNAVQSVVCHIGHVHLPDSELTSHLISSQFSIDHEKDTC